MRLWTLQDPAFFDTLHKRGVLRTDGRKIEEGPYYRAQYRWMMRQMREREKGTGKRYPLWFHDQKIDMRGVHGPGGRKFLRVEVEVPEERALVSDYMLWHSPLNNSLLAVTEAEWEAFHDEEERRLGKRRGRFILPNAWWMNPDSDYPPDLRERILDSWERIFPDRWHEFVDPGWSGPCNCGSYNDRQAVVEELYTEDVVKVEPFVARYGHWENQQKRKKAS